MRGCIGCSSMNPTEAERYQPCLWVWGSSRVFGRGCPAASYFSCLAKKSNQKKATPLPPKSPRLAHSLGRLANSPWLRQDSDIARRLPPREWARRGGGRGGKASPRDGLRLSEANRFVENCNALGDACHGGQGQRPDALSPLLTPPSGTRIHGGSRRACLSSGEAGASLRAARGFGCRTGISAEAGRAFFGYFLCTSKESNAPPGAPGKTHSNYA